MFWRLQDKNTAIADIDRNDLSQKTDMYDGLLQLPKMANVVNYGSPFN